MMRPPANRRISRSSSASISAGRAVAGEHDLPVGRLQRVGEPQQLGLHLAPVGEELDVVHQQQIDVEEALAVGLAVPRGDGGVERLDELVEREVLDLAATD